MEGSTSSMMLARESVLDFSPLIFTYSSFKFLNEFLIRFERLIFLVPFSLPFCFSCLSSGVISVPHVESFVYLFFCLDLLVSFCPSLFCPVLFSCATISWYTLEFSLPLSECSTLLSSLHFSVVLLLSSFSHNGLPSMTFSNRCSMNSLKFCSICVFMATSCATLNPSLSLLVITRFESLVSLPAFQSKSSPILLDAGFSSLILWMLFLTFIVAACKTCFPCGMIFPYLDWN